MAFVNVNIECITGMSCEGLGYGAHSNRCGDTMAAVLNTALLAVLAV